MKSTTKQTYPLTGEGEYDLGALNRMMPSELKTVLGSTPTSMRLEVGV